MERALSSLTAKLILGTLIGIFTCFLYFTPLLSRLEYISLDLLFRLRGAQPFSEKIVMIDIDDHSLAEIGRWPWSRDYHATMITLLRNLGAKVIMLDILFSEAEKGMNDQILAAAIKKAGNVYLPTGIVPGQKGNVENILEPLPQFKEAAKGTGHIHAVPEKDGVMRSIPLFVEVSREKRIPQIMLSIFLKEHNINPESIILQPGKEAIIPLENGKMYIPINSKLRTLINWTGLWSKTFRHYSFTDILIDYNRYLTGKPTTIHLDTLKDAYCIIGVTATTLYDNKPSPLEPEYPGPGINATLLNSLLLNNFLGEIPWWINLFTIMAAAIFMCLVTSRLHPWGSVFGMVSAVLAFFVANFYIFKQFNLVGTIAHPIVTLFISYIASTVYGHVKLMKERHNLSEAAQRDGLTGLYNVTNFKALLEHQILQAHMRGVRLLSVIMCDIDHFKQINDTYGHQAGDAVLKRIAKTLGSYSRTMDVVARYGGEEFIIMVPGTNINQAWEIAEKFRGIIALQQHREIEDGQLKITMSFGVATLIPGENPGDLIQRADHALYEAKNGGRNQVCKAA